MNKKKKEFNIDMLDDNLAEIRKIFEATEESTDTGYIFLAVDKSRTAVSCAATLPQLITMLVNAGERVDHCKAAIVMAALYLRHETKTGFGEFEHLILDTEKDYK